MSKHYSLFKLYREVEFAIVTLMDKIKNHTLYLNIKQWVLELFCTDVLGKKDLAAYFVDIYMNYVWMTDCLIRSSSLFIYVW